LSIREGSQRDAGHANAAITLKRYTGVLESMQSKTDEALDATFQVTMKAAAAGGGSIVEFPTRT
jgi:hypothetical protein